MPACWILIGTGAFFTLSCALIRYTDSLLNSRLGVIVGSSLFDDFPPAERIAPPSEQRLLDDDPDVAADRRQMQQASVGLRRAHAITRDDDNLLPSF